METLESRILHIDCQMEHCLSLHVHGNNSAENLFTLEGGDLRISIVIDCQEIGLVTIMFFFELVFSYVPLQFPSMFLLLTYSQSLIPLSAQYPRHSRRRRSKISIQLIQEQSKYNFTTQESLKILKLIIGSNGRPVSVPTLEL